ncbi:MAG: hypothetical protein IPK14_04685 [Blastocatellia bacterium]|nr:hypothetical protein [Blastocatellia bacterium]MBL8194272.1 hypothetical protein [Blastocatellia bacterium]MBN8725156.1 hypothetical protein [Acidobacteriota bacterium]
MITGFNTDVSYDGTTYHVQTEDKGDANPIILSLVYVRGAILAAKRTSYAKELQGGLTEQQLQSMLEKQHRTILAVIKAGRIQELVEKLSKQKSADEDAIAETPKAPSFPVAPPMPIPTIPSPQIPNQVVNKNFEVPIPSIPTINNNVEQVVSKSNTQPLFAEFDLDKIIFDYLQTDSQEEKVEINLRGAKDFYAGEAVLLQVEVSLANMQALANIPVIVKVIGTAFKPQIYSGRTGPDGVAIMPVTLPQFTAGSAAIVIQSTSDYGEAEVKHLIRRH